MKRYTYYILVFTLAILFAVCPFKSASAQVGGYIGIWGGYTINPNANTGDYRDDWDYYYHDYDLDIRESWAFGVKAGYIHPQLKYFAMEFEYSYLHPDIERSRINLYGPDYVLVEGDVKLNNFMFNFIAKYPLGIVHPYVGAGLGFTYSDMSAVAGEGSSMTDSMSIGNDYTSFSWQLLTGVEIDMANNIAVDIGYRYFSTKLEFNNAMKIEYGNDTDIDFSTSMITLGLKVLF